MKKEHVPDKNIMNQSLNSNKLQQKHEQMGNFINLKISEHFGSEPQVNDCCVIYLSMESLSRTQANNGQYVNVTRPNKKNKNIHKQNLSVLAVCRTMQGLQNWEIRISWMLRKLLRVKFWEWVTVYIPTISIPTPTLTKIVIKQLPCVIPIQYKCNPESIIKYFFRNALRPVNTNQVLEIPLPPQKIDITHNSKTQADIFGYAKVVSIEPNTVSHGIVDNATKIQMSAVGGGWNYHEWPSNSSSQPVLDNKIMGKLSQVISHIKLISTSIQQQLIINRNQAQHNHMVIFCSHQPIRQAVHNYILNTIPIPCYTLDGTQLGSSSQFVGINIMNDLKNKIRNNQNVKVLLVYNIDDVLSREYLRGSVQRRSQSMLLQLISQAHRDALIVIATASSPQATDHAILRRINKNVQIKVDKTKVFQLYSDYDSSLMGLLKAKVDAFSGRLEYQDVYNSFDQLEGQIKKYGEVPRQNRQQVSNLIAQNFSKCLNKFSSSRNLIFEAYIQETVLPQQSFRRRLYGLQKLENQLINEIENILTQSITRVNTFGSCKRHILLYGPPGCGKVSLAKSIAYELSLSCIHIKGKKYHEHEIMESHFSGSYSASQRYISKLKPCIVIIQNIEQICIEADRNGDQFTSSRGLNMILTSLDSQSRSVIYVATSDRPWEIEQSMLRPGRFDTLVYVPLPDTSTRAQLIRQSSKFQINEQMLNEMVELTEFMSCPQIITNMKKVTQKDQKEYFNQIKYTLKSNQKQQKIVEQQTDKYYWFKQQQLTQKLIKFKSINSSVDNKNNHEGNYRYNSVELDLYN